MNFTFTLDEFDIEAARIDPQLECMNSTVAETLMALELEYWSYYKILPKGHWVGTQRKDVGVSALCINRNGKLIAVAIKEPKNISYILLYDTTFSPPGVSRVWNIKGKEVTKLRFSSSLWSHLVAVFSDGTATALSSKTFSSEMASKCVYATETRDGERACDFSEIFEFNYQCFEEEKTKKIKEVKDNLQITDAVFHPGFDMFGLNQSILIASKNGSILKWNTEGVIPKTKNVPPRFNFVYLPIIATRELPFPVGSPYQMLIQKDSHVRTKDVVREFHNEHFHPIILVDYLGQEGQLVSVDSAGHIYIWNYEPHSLTPELSFHPEYKMRIILEIPQYIPESEFKIYFPAQPKGSRKPEWLDPERLPGPIQETIRKYMRANYLSNMEEFAVASSREPDGSITHVVPPHLRPKNSQPIRFNEYTVTSNGLSFLVE